MENKDSKYFDESPSDHLDEIYNPKTTWDHYDVVPISNPSMYYEGSTSASKTRTIRYDPVGSSERLELIGKWLEVIWDDDDDDDDEQKKMIRVK